MTRKMSDDEEIDERLADAQTQIESLQASAADAEARAATAREELTAAREARSSLEAELTEAAAARVAAEGELSRARDEVEEMRSHLAEAAAKYREAKLASAPEVPQDLVPAAGSLAEIDEGFEAAKRIAGQLRERIQEERLHARVPVGSPPRRPQDLSGLSGFGEDQARVERAFGALRALKEEVAKRRIGGAALAVRAARRSAAQYLYQGLITSQDISFR